MHEFVSCDGKIQLSVDPRIAAMSSAALYGRGVFTTMAIRDASPVWWEVHWNRVSEHARKLKIDVSALDVSMIGHAIYDLVRANSVDDGKARVTIFDEGSTSMWTARLAQRTRVLITTAERHVPPQPFRLTISPFRVNSASPLAGIKSCNYLEKIIARDEARTRGFDECIQLNERGEVVSAAMANVFWLKGEKLFTPSLKTGCLAGITRGRLIDGPGIECVEVEMGMSDLESADEIYLTSCGIGLVQASEFHQRKLKGEGPDLRAALTDLG